MDAEDVGEGPRAEGFDEGNAGVDAEDVSEASHTEILAEASSCCTHRRYSRRYIVDVDVREAPLAIGVEG